MKNLLKSIPVFAMLAILSTLFAACNGGGEYDKLEPNEIIITLPGFPENATHCDSLNVILERITQVKDSLNDVRAHDCAEGPTGKN